MRLFLLIIYIKYINLIKQFFLRFQSDRLSTYPKNKPKSYEIPNGTICFLTFVGNFNSVYVAKANELSKTGHYDLYDYGNLLNIGKGELNLILVLNKNLLII